MLSVCQSCVRCKQIPNINRTSLLASRYMIYFTEHNLFYETRQNANILCERGPKLVHSVVMPKQIKNKDTGKPLMWSHFPSWLTWVTTTPSPLTAQALPHSSYLLKNVLNIHRHQIAFLTAPKSEQTDLHFFEPSQKNHLKWAQILLAPPRSLLPNGVRSLLLQQA